MPSKKRRTRFVQWLDWYGREQLAEDLNLKGNTMRNWRAGLTWPNRTHLLEIIALSENKLSVGDIIEGLAEEAEIYKVLQEGRLPPGPKKGTPRNYTKKEKKG